MHAATLSLCLVLTIHDGLAALDAAPIQTGTSTLMFAERHPHSSFEAMQRRWRWPASATIWKQGAYTIADESFTAHVPAGYDGTRPYGLLVWMSDGDKGDVVPAWTSVLDRHQVIWIGANRAGFSRNPQTRLALALDAVHNMARRCAIDAGRVYIAGGPGNVGRQANWQAVTFPDVFAGSIAMGMCDHYVTISAGAGAGLHNGFLTEVDQALIAAARARRFAFVGGSLDPGHLAKMTLVVDAYRADGFHRCALFEVPGLGPEQYASAEWFERAIRFVDRPARWRAARGDTLLDALARKGVKPPKGQFTPAKPLRTAVTDAQARTSRGGAQAAEATVIAATAQEWMTAQVDWFGRLATQRPAQAADGLEQFVDVVRGLPSEAEALRILEPLRQDADVARLGRLRVQAATVLDALEAQGATPALIRSRNALRTTLAELRASVDAGGAVAAESDDLLLDL